MPLRLNHSLSRNLTSSLTRGVRYRRPNPLAEACRALNQAIKMHQAWAKSDPQFWDFGWAERERRQAEVRRAEDEKVWNEFVSRCGHLFDKRSSTTHA